MAPENDSREPLGPDPAPEGRAVILAAIDLAHEPDIVLAAAARHARVRKDSDVHLLHVVPTPQANLLTAGEVLEEARDRFEVYTEWLQRDLFGRVFVHVVVGDPWRDIVELATALSADLVLIGTHGRTGVAHAVLGSVAERVVRHAPCTVVVLRPKAHQTDEVGIEPPCPECLSMQRASLGKTLWCARHSRARLRPHLHYEMPRGFGEGSMFIRR